MASNGENPHKVVWPADVSGTGYVGTEVSALSWAPRGHQLAFIEHHYTASAFSAGDLFTVKTRDLITGKSQMILSDQRIESQALCWAPDGRLLYASLTDPKSERSDYGVWAIEVDQQTGKAKGSPERVSNGMGWIGGLSVTTNGKRLIVVEREYKISSFCQRVRQRRAPSDGASSVDVWTRMQIYPPLGCRTASPFSFSPTVTVPGSCSGSRSISKPLKS